MRKILLLLFGGWILLIIWFSAQPAEQSKITSGILVKTLINMVTTLVPAASGIQEQQLHGVVRKVAHAVNYFVLGGLTYQVFRLNIRVKKEVWLAVGVIIFCISFAAVDEFYQTYVPGRSGELRDVLLDSGSALAGLFVCRRYHQKFF